MQWDFSTKPLLVFWETTKACLLACKHCRAEAIPSSLPGELSFDEACNLIEGIRSFGRPYPILILTGGDLLNRQDIFTVIGYARKHGLPVAVSPAVTRLLTKDALEKFLDLGVSSISFSLDGMEATHDFIRGVGGTWATTLGLAKTAMKMGLNVQVNTCVMKQNYHELPELFALIKELGVKVWEVFFLIKIGRGTQIEELNPHECEAVANFLYDASRYGVTVRTVEAPFYRRIVIQRSRGKSTAQSEIYKMLLEKLLQLCGPYQHNAPSSIGSTGDGKGIVFIGYDGTVFPGGFLPVPRGNVRSNSLQELYRSDQLFNDLRNPMAFAGRCGICEFRELCGGSRARAYTRFGDSLAEDPACAYVPHATK
ncbi:MAG: TIGR04053 family radical SAM/SPASM domain-containing protein [Thaumarchaeota archaeon]|nr:TIGR04053 family radical SAM/SPASM domain-containing protein [Nitrososphaerota archaeon]